MQYVPRNMQYVGTSKVTLIRKRLTELGIKSAYASSMMLREDGKETGCFANIRGRCLLSIQTHPKTCGGPHVYATVRVLEMRRPGATILVSPDGPMPPRAFANIDALMAHISFILEFVMRC